MVLVDTNIVAYLVLDGAMTARARQLYERDADWRAEPLLFVELCNVLETAMRATGLTLPRALAALADAHRILGAGLHAASDGDVIAAASRHGTSGYDARFLCAAAALGVPLVTEDAALRRKAPALTRSLAEALAASA